MHQTVGKTGQRLRTDIQGLRAIAVLGVVAFHFGASWIPGGYVGVDVFFVISGYLITKNLRDELILHGRVDLLGFYGRRALRLVPSAATVILATLVAAYFIFSPPEQTNYTDDAIYTASYALNLHLLFSSFDYFGMDAGSNPFLHFWSLAVEEQFYFVWPLLLALALRRRALTVPIVVLIALASLSACIVVTAVSQPWAFYFFPTRAWELLAGALLCFARPIENRSANEICRAVGVLLIACSYAMLTEGLAFPGYLAALPVAGTVLTIQAGKQRGGSPLAYLLDSQPAQFIGRLSYPIYLWHWPVAVFAGLFSAEMSLVTVAVCYVVTLALACLSQALIENPFRKHTWLVSNPLRLVSLLVGTTLALSGAALAFNHIARQQSLHFAAITSTAKRLSLGNHQGRQKCLSPLAVDEPVTCIFGNPDAKKSVVLFGDSHADMFSTPLIRLAERDSDFRVITLTKSSCSAAVIETWSSRLKRPFAECARWREKAISKINELAPQLTIIAQFSSSYVGEKPAHKVLESEWQDGLRMTISRIETGKVMLIEDMPVMTQHVPNCLSRSRWWGVSIERCHSNRAEVSLGELTEVERATTREFSNAFYVGFTETVCDQNVCRAAFRGEIPTYRDTHHISTAFAETLTDTMGKAVRPLLDTAVAHYVSEVRP